MPVIAFGLCNLVVFFVVYIWTKPPDLQPESSSDTRVQQRLQSIAFRPMAALP